MQTLGLVGYLCAGLLFALLTILLTFNWKGQVTGLLFVAASAVSAAWALLLAYTSSGYVALDGVTAVAEAAHDSAWILFLLAVLRRENAGWHWTLGQALCVGMLLHAAVGASTYTPAALNFAMNAQFLLMALLGLALVEQLYRNSKQDRRRDVGYLCLGLGGLFVYDLALFSNASLSSELRPELWAARGFVHALMVPPLAVAARRNVEWTLDVFVSRKVVFYSTTFIVGGLYCILMGVVAYYIRLQGGQWGPALMSVFIVAAALVGLTIVYSARLTAHIKVFLSKHFYRNRYEYRDEWLRLIQTLSSSGTPLRERTVRALGQIVGAQSGVLWQLTEDGSYAATAGWNSEEVNATLRHDDPFVQFLLHRQWIVDTRELARDPDRYGGLILPEACKSSKRTLLVPLIQEPALRGFIALHDPRHAFELNYEDYDLLKTVGRQIASYLAEEEAKERLARGRQFEAYNQLTAFMMHDLKNVIAQQSLLVRNAAKFKHNPAFVDDTIQTIHNSVERMQHLLSQLTRGSLASDTRSVDLRVVLEDVARKCADRTPHPVVRSTGEMVRVRTNAERLGSILSHLVRNAQDATPAEGEVKLELSRVGNQAVIEIVDTGIGMDASFVRDRLFRPFDTTKGSKGMGIGAYQAREFVREAGGRMSVESARGLGTRIRVELPLGGEAEAKAPLSGSQASA